MESDRPPPMFGEWRGMGGGGGGGGGVVYTNCVSTSSGNLIYSICNIIHFTILREVVV